MSAATSEPAAATAIRPFRIDVRQEEIDGLDIQFAHIHELMLRLGYARYVSQGGDWGAIVSGEPESVLTYDEMLDAISLYWLTNTATSSSRSYWEGAQAGGGPFDAFDIPELPVAVTVFPAEIYPAPRSWGEQAFGNLIHWNDVDKGGHFAAWEQPELFSQEVRAAFTSLRPAGAATDNGDRHE